MKEMYRIYEKELDRFGHSPVIFPLVIPESNFQVEAEHVEGFTPEVFWITHAGSNPLEERLALRPTSETAMYPLYSLWINSYRDLPLKLYQSGSVFRYEGKSTKPFLRSREFMWIEAHDVFATHDEAVAQVHEDMQISKNVLTGKFGIPFIGFERPQWDKFAGAEKTFAADALMPNGRFLQLPSTHLLGDKFARAFNVVFQDEDKENKFAYQTCYGPAISRIFGGLIATHGDDKGLIFPWDVAPVQVVIVPILKKATTEKVLKFAKELQETLVSASIRVKIDESDKRPGEKYYHWEMKGVPLRFEIGGKEADDRKVTVFRRDTREKALIDIQGIAQKATDLGEKLTANLFEKSSRTFEGRIRDAETWEQMEEILEKRYAARIPYCTIDMPGEECATAIKDRLTAEVRGIELGDETVPNGKKCLVCGKEAKVFVVVGHQY